MPDSATRLTTASLPTYLLARGLVAAGDTIDVHELSGGVSCSVFAVNGQQAALIVKQALPQLRVAQTWLADPSRAGNEAEALRLFSALTPQSTPVLLDADEDNHCLTMSHAPPDWQNWKLQLMAGVVDPEVGADLGAVLARWHAGTQDASTLDPRFYDLTQFHQLRISPYFGALKERHPGEHAAIKAVVHGVLTDRRCLVHGDFSPKNILVGPTGSWILDFEVAHYGDPTFDVAFLLTHLLLKATHLPRSHEQLRTCADAFLSAYCAVAPTHLLPSAERLAGVVACLLLARVDGKSPAGYLTAHEQSVVRRLGLALLRTEMTYMDEAFSAAATGTT